MDESSRSKKLAFSQLEGSTKEGRQKLRWLDDVLQDVKISNLTIWWKKGTRPWYFEGPRLTGGCNAR
jgi:hypothetical protein